MRPCLKSRTNSSSGSSSSQGLSFSTLSSCTPSTSAQCQGTTDACRIRKCVAFEADGCLETVFTADEWDRTPTEPARKLSYQDLLELKEIQRSLPRANQPPDHLAGRAARQYLSTVPISLLPLLPSTTPATPPSSYATSPDPSPSGSPAPTSWNPHSNSTIPGPHTTAQTPRSNWTPIQSPTSPTIPSSPSADPSGETRWVSFNPDSPRDPGSLASTSPPPRSNLHAPRPSLPQQTGRSYPYPLNVGPPAPSYPPPPSNPLANKQKPRFAFLPLLDSQHASDSASPSSPSMSPTSAPRPTPSSHPSSSGQATSPVASKAYSNADADPPYFQLPPPKRGRQGSIPTNPSGATNGSRFSAYYNREGGDWEGDRQHRSFGSALSGSSSTTFGRSNPAFQAMYPTGTTLSPSSSRAGSRHPSPARPEAPAPATEKKKNVMVINGIEFDLDDGEDETAPAPPPAPKKKNVMVINGIEIDLDDDDDEPAPTAPLKVAQPQPSSPIAQPRPLSPAVSLPGSRSSSSSSSPKSGPVGSSTTNGLPTPPPSTSPSPVPSWRSLPVEQEPEKESPFVGLHAPVTFKRGAPRPVVTLPTVPASPPKVSSPGKATSPMRSRAGSTSSSGSSSPSRVRRGSVCGQQSGRVFDPRASPRLVPQA